MKKLILTIASFLAICFFAACSGDGQAEILAPLTNPSTGQYEEAQAHPSETPSNTQPEEPSNLQANTTTTSITTIPSMQIQYWHTGTLQEITPPHGLANWFTTHEDGTISGILTDSPHPLQVINHLPIIDRTTGAGPLLELSFQSQPDTITAKRWQINEATDYTSYTKVFVAGTTINIPDSDNSYVYEITARWPHQDHESFVTYAFYVTSSPQVEGPRRTPQLYVSLNIEDMSAQSFQALQLSNNWWPTISDENAPQSGGYCATSYHPIDAWARDFLNYLGREEDAVTFFLYGTEGEIELLFSDNFPPQAIYVRRWPAEFAVLLADGSSDMELWFQYEPVEINDNTFRIINDGNNYIYEIEAIWPQGRSSYTFRVDCAS